MLARLDNPIASAGNVDMVRPIEEEAMTALNAGQRPIVRRSDQLLEVHDLGEATRQCGEGDDSQCAEP